MNPEIFRCIQRMYSRIWIFHAAALFFFTIILLFLYPLSLQASELIHIGGDESGVIEVQNKIGILEDRDGTLSFEDVSSKAYENRFVLNASGSPGKGFSSSVFWMRLRFQKARVNTSHWYLHLRYPLLDYVDFYYPRRDGSYGRFGTGDALPFDSRPVKSINYVFPLDLSDEESICYLSLRSKGAITFPLSLESEEFFLEQARNRAFFQTLFFGAVLVMILYNLFIFFSVRERVYLYYSSHVFFIFLYEFIYMGFAFYYLWPRSPLLNYYLDHFSSNMVSVFLALFAMEFLGTASLNRFLHRLLGGIALIALATGISFFFIDRSYAYFITQMLLMVLFIVLVAAVILGIARKKREAWYFLLAWSVMIGGTTILILSKVNIIPTFPGIVNVVLAGLLMNIVILSLGLADRINNLKNKLLFSEETIRNHNMELVAANEELEATNEEFEAQNQMLQHAYREVEERERRFRELSELLPLTIFEMDLAGRITYTNLMGYEESGYSEEDLKAGVSLFQLIPVEEHGTVAEHIKQIIENDLSVSREYRMKRKDGSVFPVMSYSRLIRNDDRPAGIRGVALNLTEQKKTQEIMIRSEKMSTVAGLAAGMAHEINNPLGIILSGIQNALRRLSPESETNREVAEKIGIDIDRMREYLEERKIGLYLRGVEDAGRRAAVIVANMLNFSRKDSTSMELCDINGILDTALDLAEKDYDLKKKYDFKRIAIVKDYGTIPFIPVMRTEIEQVVFNLLRNAAQAMFGSSAGPGDPRITLMTRADENSVVIGVSDNGPGMSAEIREKIFEPFFTTKAAGEGTGLGLAVAFFIITQNHNGSMSVESEMGKGAAFIITLPLKCSAV